MARSSAALRHPPAPVPSAPAGDFAGKSGPVHGEVQDQSGLLGVGVEKQRRRGRGTLSNASGRYEPIARIAFDEGFADAGQRIIITAGLPLGTPGATNMLRIAYVGKGGAAGN